ncbi:aminotransferase class I/II-fold pyridoxal phosphate-dependent enzyme [Corynebacterium epidermidicanis]|uniref:8-amino-7-oxononanoate synthase n=1 Tax=Corynebacterium epidermidicanis TaxID=1050174 RepID=A0A0G3GRC7_9CORY|nr:8-amino-7-oxononanoate synthase [Corynebacterium epidermidicanis]AKK03664.1 7-keto-8-aminopelargonate synthetase-like enzyme [Corynebacterium epidermidicanis]
MSLNERAADANTQWRALGLERTPATISQLSGAHATIEGCDFVLFSSSDYLGLSQHPALCTAAIAAHRRFGAGSTGSRLTTGTTAPHVAAEAAIASFIGSEDAVFFATGYQANVSTIQALASMVPGLTVFSDQLNHASIIDGCRLARVPVRVYPHLNYVRLDEMLSASTAEAKLIVSDGLFSMDGDTADIARLQQLCHQHRAWLYIDDAHAIGTIGPSGRGTAELAGGSLPDILIVTASKALGAEGGFVCCPTELATWLRNRARSYVFSTAAAPSVPASISAALPLIPQHLPTLRSKQAQFAALTGLSISSPIVPIHVGSETDAMNASAQLKRQGLWVPAIRYPTVARGQAILRVTITAQHEDAHLAQLASALAELRLI